MGHQQSDSDRLRGSEEKQARAELISKLSITGVWVRGTGQSTFRKENRKKETEGGQEGSGEGDIVFTF